MSVCDFKTGEDVNVNITLNPKEKDGTPIPIGTFDQIVIIFYYLLDGVKTKFSWHALDHLEANIVAEAAAATPPVTLRDFNLNGNVAELKLPREDTDSLSFSEDVQVLVDIMLEDSAADRTRGYTDKPVGSMRKAVTEGYL